MAGRVKARCFELGLLVLGLSGTVDGKQGETIVLAPVSPLGLVRNILDGVHRTSKQSPESAAAEGDAVHR